MHLTSDELNPNPDKDKPPCNAQDNQDDTWEHIAIFSALGYVQASKRDKNFFACAPNYSYAALCERLQRVFNYRQPTPMSTVLYNRKESRQVGQVAKQQVASLETSDPILGFQATNERLFVLTTKNLFLVKIGFSAAQTNADGSENRKIFILLNRWKNKIIKFKNKSEYSFITSGLLGLVIKMDEADSIKKEIYFVSSTSTLRISATDLTKVPYEKPWLPEKSHLATPDWFFMIHCEAGMSILPEIRLYTFENVHLTFRDSDVQLTESVSDKTERFFDKKHSLVEEDLLKIYPTKIYILSSTLSPKPHKSYGEINTRKNFIKQLVITESSRFTVWSVWSNLTPQFHYEIQRWALGEKEEKETNLGAYEDYHAVKREHLEDSANEKYSIWIVKL
eukprot:bmy_16582T0